MKPHKFTPQEEVYLTDPDFAREAVGLFQKFGPEESYEIGFSTSRSQYMQAYVDRLAKAGLDIGKGDSAFGYRMPLPEKGDTSRSLIIFRRK